MVVLVLTVSDCTLDRTLDQTHRCRVQSRVRSVFLSQARATGRSVSPVSDDLTRLVAKNISGTSLEVTGLLESRVWSLVKGESGHEQNKGCVVSCSNQTLAC
jgi:hypothetical protein